MPSTLFLWQHWYICHCTGLEMPNFVPISVKKNLGEDPHTPLLIQIKHNPNSSQSFLINPPALLRRCDIFFLFYFILFFFAFHFFWKKFVPPTFPFSAPSYATVFACLSIFRPRPVPRASCLCAKSEINTQSAYI